MDKETFQEFLNEPIDMKEVDKRLQLPDSFAYFGKDKELVGKTWCIGPTIVHRDSGIMDQSNSEALLKALKEPINEISPEDWEVFEASHWAVGWVKHLKHRVIDDAGKLTKVYRFIRAWYKYLSEIYPIADEDDYSIRETEATSENVKNALKNAIANWNDPRYGLDGGKLTEGYLMRLAGEVECWLQDNCPNALENQDDQGGWPNEEELSLALNGLGWHSNKKEE